MIVAVATRTKTANSFWPALYLSCGGRGRFHAPAIASGFTASHARSSRVTRMSSQTCRRFCLKSRNSGTIASAQARPQPTCSRTRLAFPPRSRAIAAGNAVPKNAKLAADMSPTPVATRSTHESALNQCRTRSPAGWRSSSSGAPAPATPAAAPLATEAVPASPAASSARTRSPRAFKFTSSPPATASMPIPGTTFRASGVVTFQLLVSQLLSGTRTTPAARIVSRAFAPA